MRDGQKVQHGIGGATGGHDDGDCIFDRFARDDIARLDVFFDRFDQHRRRRFGGIELFVVRVGHGAGINQRNAQGLEGAGHGVGRVHAPARAGAGNGALLDFVQIKVAQITGGVLAYGFEHAHDIEVLAFVAAGQNRAAVDIDRRYIGTQHAHQTAWHVFVTAANHHHAVHPLALHAGLDAIGNHFAADQGIFHPLGAHGHTVRDGGRAKHLGIASSFFNPRDGRVRQFLQAAVARGNRAVSVGNADHRLFEVGFLVAHGVVHGAVGRTRFAFSDIGAAAVDGQDGDSFFGHGAVRKALKNASLLAAPPAVFDLRPQAAQPVAQQRVRPSFWNAGLRQRGKELLFLFLGIHALGSACKRIAPTERRMHPLLQ